MCVQVDEARGDVAAVCIVTYAAGYFIVSRLYADNFPSAMSTVPTPKLRSGVMIHRYKFWLFVLFSFHNSDQ